MPLVTKPKADNDGGLVPTMIGGKKKRMVLRPVKGAKKQVDVLRDDDVMEDNADDPELNEDPDESRGDDGAPQQSLFGRKQAGLCGGGPVSDRAQTSVKYRICAVHVTMSNLS